MRLRKRRGCFKISTKIIDDNPEIVMMAMARCLVIRAEHLLAYNCVEYCALSPEFDVVSDAVITPEYRVEITQDEAGSNSIMFTPVE